MSNTNLPKVWKITKLGSFMDFKNGVNADKEAYGKSMKLVNCFPKNWEILSLSEIGSFSKGKGITKSQLTDKGLPCIRYGEIYTTHHNTIKKFHSFIPANLAKKSKKLKFNDLLFAGSGETVEEIGKAVGYRLQGEAYAGADIIILHVPQKHSADYMAYFLNSIGRYQLNKFGTGNSVVHIYKKDLGKVKIALPSRLEQDAIVKTLREWNKAIDKTETLIAAKERQIGWLQNSLMDKKFKTYSSHLSQYAGILKQQKIDQVGSLKPLKVKLHCKGMEPSERNTQITLSKKGRPYFQRFSGEFMIGRQNFHNGGFGIVPPGLNGFIASNAITSLDIDESKLDAKYLFYFFSRKDYYLRIGHIVNGTGQKELSDKQIMTLHVSIPDLEKQKEVVILLDTAQKEINLLKKLADQYRTQKRGLMQKLLSGEWRIRNKEAA